MDAPRVEQTKALEPPANQVVPKWFVFSSGAILATTGVARIWSSFGNAKLLWHPDPVLGIEFRHLMLAVGLLELGIAFICCCTKKTDLQHFW